MITSKDEGDNKMEFEGRTLKQIFKAVNDINNAYACLGKFNEEFLTIYIDDTNFYNGRNYNDFVKLLNEEYVKGFAEELLNILYVGSETNYFMIRNVKHKIEVYFF